MKHTAHAKVLHNEIINNAHWIRTKSSDLCGVIDAETLLKIYGVLGC